MPMNLSVNISPRPTTNALRTQPQSHPRTHSATERTRSALKRRITTIFRERIGEPNSSDTIGTTNNSSTTSRHLRRSTSISGLKHKVPHARRTPLNNPMPSIQQNLPRESPPSYTILAPAPNDRLVVAHPSPSPSRSSDSTNAHAQPWDQLYIPPRMSSIVCRQLGTTPSVAEIDESSHTFIQTLYNDQVRRLVRSRVTQEQADRDLALALHLQELQDQGGELVEQQPLRHSQSTATLPTQSDISLVPSQMQRSLSTATTQTQWSRTLVTTPTERSQSMTAAPSQWSRSRVATPTECSWSTTTASSPRSRDQVAIPTERSHSIIMVPSTSSSFPTLSSSTTTTAPRLARQCVICKGRKTFAAFPKHKPTDVCGHENSTCSRCLRHWVKTKLRFRGVQGVNCSQCRIMLNAHEIHRARLSVSSGY